MIMDHSSFNNFIIDVYMNFFLVFIFTFIIGIFFRFDFFVKNRSRRIIQPEIEFDCNDLCAENCPLKIASRRRQENKGHLLVAASWLNILCHVLEN